MTPIKNSSNIKAVGYDEATKKLTIEFHSGGGSKWVYEDVDPKHFSGIQEAESAGKYFSTYLRALKGTKVPAPE